MGIAGVVQGCRDKIAAIEGSPRSAGVPLRRCACLVDDTPDLPLMSALGFAAAVADAHPLVRAAADWVSRCPGGAGAARELCDAILRAARRGALMLARILTVLALAALAIGTWILSNESRTQRMAQQPRRIECRATPLKGAVLTDYNLAGMPGVRIAAERIEQIDQSTDVELHNVRLDYQSDAGQLWVMVGDRAHVRQDGRIVDVDGNVQMQGLDQGRQGPAVVSTDHIAYDVNASEVRTDSAVRISFGEHTLTAQGLVARLKERTMRLESKVYGRFTP